MLQKETVAPELLSILSSLQGDPLFKDYILAGGTALALQLGHRKSVDIDIFTVNKQDNHQILNYFQDNYKYYELLRIDNDILQLIIRNIKIDMVTIKQNILETPITEDGITLFGKKDIAAMKLRAILFRNNPRDYIDIAYLLKEMSIRDMFDLYKQKFNANDIAVVKTAIIASKYIEKDKWNEDIFMLKNDINLLEVPKILENEIKKYNKKYDIGEKKSLFHFLNSKKTKAKLNDK